MIDAYILKLLFIAVMALLSIIFVFWHFVNKNKIHIEALEDDLSLSKKKIEDAVAEVNADTKKIQEISRQLTNTYNKMTTSKKEGGN